MAYQISFEQLLLEQGLIGNEQLYRAQAFQSRWGGRLEEALLHLNLVDEGALLFALAERSGVAPVKIANLNVSAKVIGLLPEKLLRRYGVFPLAIWDQVQPRRLVIAMADPSDQLAREEVMHSTRMQLKIVQALRRDIEQAITRHFDKSSVVGMRQAPSLRDVSTKH